MIKSLFFFTDSKEDLSSVPHKSEFPVKLRLHLGDHVTGKPTTPGDRSFLHVTASDLDLAMNISSLTNLAEIMEDEVIGPMMPLLVEATNCSFTLKVCLKFVYCLTV